MARIRIPARHHPSLKRGLTYEGGCGSDGWGRLIRMVRLEGTVRLDLHHYLGMAGSGLRFMIPSKRWGTPCGLVGGNPQKRRRSYLSRWPSVLGVIVRMKTIPSSMLVQFASNSWYPNGRLLSGEANHRPSRGSLRKSDHVRYTPHRNDDRARVHVLSS